MRGTYSLWTLPIRVEYSRVGLGFFDEIIRTSGITLQGNFSHSFRVSNMHSFSPDIAAISIQSPPPHSYSTHTSSHPHNIPITSSLSKRGATILSSAISMDNKVGSFHFLFKVSYYIGMASTCGKLQWSIALHTNSIN